MKKVMIRKMWILFFVCWLVSYSFGQVTLMLPVKEWVIFYKTLVLFQTGADFRWQYCTKFMPHGNSPGCPWNVSSYQRRWLWNKSRKKLGKVSTNHTWESVSVRRENITLWYTCLMINLFGMHAVFIFCLLNVVKML